MTLLVKISCKESDGTPHEFWVSDDTQYFDVGAEVYPFISKGVTEDTNLLGSNRLFGVASPEYGTITLDNTTGALDYLEDYILDGAELEVYEVEGVTHTLKSTLKATKVVFNYDDIVLTLTSARGELNVPIQTHTFPMIGPSSPVDDFNGAAEVLGKIKPVLYGFATGVTPYLLNAAHLIYATNYTPSGNLAEATIWYVHDKGGMLTPSPDEPAVDLAALKALEVPPGHFAVCLNEGLIKLGSKPKGAVTVDLFSPRTPSLEALLMDAGVDYDFDSLNKIHDINTGQRYSGYYVTGNETYLEVLSHMLGNFNAYAYADETGKLFFGTIWGRNLFPAPVAEINEDNIYKKSVKKLPAPTPDGIPIKSLTVRHTKIYSPTDNLVASLPEEERVIRSSPYQELTLTSDWNFHPLAKTLEVSRDWTKLGPLYIPSFIGTYPRDWWVVSAGSPTFHDDGSITISSKQSIRYAYERPYPIGNYNAVELNIEIQASGDGPSTDYLEISADNTVFFHPEGTWVYRMTLENNLFMPSPVTISPDASEPITIQRFMAYNYAGWRHFLALSKYYLNLLSSEQRRYQVEVVSDLYDFRVGDIATLRLPRYNLQDGKDFMVTRVSKEYGTKKTLLELWRPEEQQFGYFYTPTTLNQGTYYSIGPTVLLDGPIFAEVISGSLPPGMTLNPITLFIAGTPTTAGVYTCQIGAISSEGNTYRMTLTMTVVDPT